ncbi:NUDIX hydrolase [Zhouia amylolytica]|uniref:Isopentenyldiphosphate isomerase n=1 Tax=Zhouia amylolytica AD3 TaxID=1286632 RepID=W2UQZ6_9FLAO|nr:NUDIX domain-containing protein [Zhouia amylolytica]ETN96359.1 isopentenyldiphosphate isomerase [Zhouia amylolytica AD3]MCQ0112154.1 NUDIX domain-containing protein [Zhouia amylolytica]
MDEYVDILDDKGNYTGKSLLKSEAHQLGLFHPTIHVWLYTNKGDVLIQKRVATKNTFPGLWDVSVAGHISAGESILTSAIREVEEELGLKLKESDLHKIGTHKHTSTHGTIIDAEFHHIYIAELKVPIDTLTLQASEVEAIKLIPLQEYTSEINKNHANNHYVVLDEAYYELVFEGLQQAIKM